MLLDFKEIDLNGDDFELLIRELLYNKGLEVYWSGKGPDGGKDLLCIERYNSCFKSFSRRWLVQCKHNAHSGKSVSVTDLGAIENACGLYNADAYLLVCSTYPSSTVVNTLEGIEKNGKITTAFWDCRALERQLLIPENWSIVNMFFPNYAQNAKLQISKIDSCFWHVNYKGNIFYFSLRIGTNCDFFLKYITDLVDEINSVKLPDEHYIRIRAAYFDDKYTNFLIYLDYLFPLDMSEDDFSPSEEVISLCNERIVNGIYYNIDLKFYECNVSSDNFDLDHQSYYSYYISFFKTGIERCEKSSMNRIFKDNPKMFTEELKEGAFLILSETFKKIPFINVLHATNANVENISHFSDNFSWGDIIEASDYEIDSFFGVKIRFECHDFEQLCQLLNTLPTSVTKHFELNQHHIFLPETGYDIEETGLYTLNIDVHPAIGVSKYQFRQFLNQYMLEINCKILQFLEM